MPAVSFNMGKKHVWEEGTLIVKVWGNKSVTQLLLHRMRLGIVLLKKVISIAAYIVPNQVPFIISDDVTDVQDSHTVGTNKPPCHHRRSF